MKLSKLFLIISFTLLLVAKVFCQAAVDIPLIVTDGTFNIQLFFGLDLTATNCIDTLLGEGEDPIPPPGVFDTRFSLVPYGCGPVTTKKDYRAPGNPPAFPFTGTIQHTLGYQTSSMGLDIDITYDLPEGTQMSITDQIGGTFLNLGPFTGQGIATIPGSYTNIFSQALLIIEYDNIVPVELTSFTASILQNENAVQLNWTTATETNNSGFEIERQVGSGQSAVGNWISIGFVPGFGTTTEPKSYSFIDDLTLTPNLTHTLRYQLKQIDFDGTFTYSNEIEVEVDFTPKRFVLYQNYPNPFNPTTTIKYEIPNVETTRRVVFTTLKVYDILGNEVATLVNEEKQPGVYEAEFIGTNYSSGVYYYVMTTGNFIDTKKFVLLK